MELLIRLKREYLTETSVVLKCIILYTKLKGVKNLTETSVVLK